MSPILPAFHSVESSPGMARTTCRRAHTHATCKRAHTHATRCRCWTRGQLMAQRLVHRLCYMWVGIQPCRMLHAACSTQTLAARGSYGLLHCVAQWLSAGCLAAHACRTSAAATPPLPPSPASWAASSAPAPGSPSCCSSGEQSPPVESTERSSQQARHGRSGGVDSWLGQG